MDKLLSSFNSSENSDEIEFPLLILTGGFSESVLSIIFMKSSQELNEFIDQLNTKQFKEVEEFFRTMPKLTHTLKVKNPKTGVESEVVLEGLVSFFS